VQGTVYVCETFDRDSNAARTGTKTDAPRMVPIPATLLTERTRLRPPLERQYVDHRIGNAFYAAMRSSDTLGR
jgi:hypothetical protein